MREGRIREGEGKRHQLLVSSLPEQTKKVKSSFWICRRTEIIQKTAATQTGDQKEANTENHNLLEEKPININFSKTSAKEGKTELSLVNCCRLKVHKAEGKTTGGPGHTGALPPRETSTRSHSERGRKT